MRSHFSHYSEARTISDSWQHIVSELTSLRHKHAWSQEELAHRIGVTPSLIHKWETYKRVPSNFLFVCWLDALQAEIEIRPKW